MLFRWRCACQILKGRSDRDTIPKSLDLNATDLVGLEIRFVNYIPYQESVFYYIVNWL